jgi:hypothetical protein
VSGKAELLFELGWRSINESLTALTEMSELGLAPVEMVQA